MRIFLLATTLFTFIAGDALPVQARSEADDIGSIRAAGKAWAKAYADGRYGDIPALYTADTMVMPRGRPRIEGRESMRRSVGGLAAGRRVDIEVTEREIRAVGDYGWYIGDFKVTYTPVQAGGAPVSEYGRSLIIFRRDADGQWRIHRDIDSPAPHPVDPAPALPVAAAGPPRLAALSGTLDNPAQWDPDTRTIAVACDRLTASRYDRTRLAPPVARQDIDVPRAIATCEADLARLPGDARLLFQLGRLYGYAGDREKTLAARRAAAAAGNGNAIFLLAFLDFQAAKDDAARCQAGQRMKLAADRGNYSAQLTYAAYFTQQRFAPCADAAPLAEVQAYVAAATPKVDGFFETRLAEQLAADLERLSGEEDRARLIDQMAGVWTGTFRRYDAAGALIEAIPSEVKIDFGVEGQDYRQTNILRRAGRPEERIDTTGRWDGGKLRFANARVEGWFGPLDGDSTGRVSVLQMTIKGSTPTTMTEILAVSPDGANRMRIAQYVSDGKIVRRTLIDEKRVR